MRRRFPSARRGVVILLALIVALGGGLRAYRAANPASEHQSADELAYTSLAIGLAEHAHWGSVRFDSFHWPPGAPFMFALGDLGGHHTASSAAVDDIPAAYWLQFLVGTLCILATFGLAAIVGGTPAGLVAALLVAIYPPLVRSTGELLSEPLGALLLTATLLALARAWERGGTREYALAGALFGLTILTRTDFLLLPFVLAAVIALALWRRGRKQGTPGGWWRGPGALALATLLMIAPWSIFASSRKHTLVPVTTGDAPALFVGTFLPGDGTTGDMKKALFKEVVKAHPGVRRYGSPYNIPAGIVLDTVAARHPGLTRDAALRKEAFANLRHDISHPLDTVAMMARKLGRMWGKSSRAGSPIASHWTRTFHLVLVILSTLLLLAAIVRLRDARLIGALIVLLYSTALHALVVAKPRYNVPLMPLLIAAGAAAAGLLWARRQAARASPQP